MKQVVANQKTCFIFGARNVPHLLVQETISLYGEMPFVIAADAGWHQAVQNGLTPHVVLGDFDSGAMPKQQDLITEGTNPVDTEWIVLPAEKDDTDLHYAAKEALKRGVKTVVLLGVLGGRFDHSMASLATLSFLRENDVQAVILDENTQIHCVLPLERLCLPNQKNCYVSVFPLGEKAEGVCMQGVHYPVHDAVLTSSFPLGVSNEFTGEEANISCKTGGLFVLVVKKDAPVL